MIDGAVFTLVFVGFFVIRAIVATVFFYFIMPEGDRCPCCDTPTIRMASRAWGQLLPWFRKSWCYNCHWEGLLRQGPLTPTDAAPARPAKTGKARE